MATLKIKNQSGEKLEFPTPVGPVKLDPGSTADLSDKELASQGLADALQSGKVVFVVDPHPAKDRVELAKAVLPRLASGTSAKLDQAKKRFDQAQKELIHLRQDYNKTWKAAETHLSAAKGTADVWPSLYRAIKEMVFDTEVEDASVREKKEALAALEKELEELKELMPEKLAEKGFLTLYDWHNALVAKQQAVKEARDASEKVSKDKTNPLRGQIYALNESVGKMAAIARDKNKAIGTEIPEFGV